jgi:uncharacterized Ntn-hydrolase superfamily protein
MRPCPSLSTFSIVAYDPQANEWGVATQSKFLAVGSAVPWAQAGAGAVATQSYANTSFGPRGLALMTSGLSAQETLERLLADDEGREQRQVGLVDARGSAATFTGRECLDWAGGLTGTGFAVQGNILVSEATVKAIAEVFEKARGELADRLVAALAAGQKAGGDRRGQQSAALLVVREKGGYAGFNDRYIDLRVDDAPRPIERLRQLLKLHHLYFKRPDPSTLIAIDAKVARALSRIARQSGYYTGPLTSEYGDALRKAVENLMGMENLEERWQPGAQIDPVVLAYLQRAYPAPQRAGARQAQTASRRKTRGAASRR